MSNAIKLILVSSVMLAACQYLQLPLVPTPGIGDYTLEGGIMAMPRMTADGPQSVMKADVRQMVRMSDFVFQGQVMDIQYRDSENAPGNDDNVARGVPHTFVTYIVDTVFKGPSEMEGQEFTLRVMGGAGNGGDILEVGHDAQYDINDFDILMVKGNTEKPCALVNCMMGRFRAIQGPTDREEMMYTEHGQTLFRMNDVDGNVTNAVKGFEFVELEEVMTQHVLIKAGLDGEELEDGEQIITLRSVEESSDEEVDGQRDPEVGEGDLPGPQNAITGFHMSLDDFRGYMLAAVQATHTSAELRDVPTPTSASPRRPFELNWEVAINEFSGTDVGDDFLDKEPQPPVEVARHCVELEQFESPDQQADCLEAYYLFMSKVDPSSGAFDPDFEGQLTDEQIREIQSIRGIKEGE